MAAIRDKIATNVQPFLRPGEQVQGTLAGQTQSQYVILLAGLIFLLTNRYRTIVATDQRILVLDAGRWTQTKCNAVVVELPRTTKLGPPNGTLWHKVQLGTETIRVHKRFHKDIVAIDALS